MSPIMVRYKVQPDLAETNAEVCGPVRQRTTSSRADRLRCRSRQALPRRPVECPDEHADGEIGPQPIWPFHRACQKYRFPSSFNRGNWFNTGRLSYDLVGEVGEALADGPSLEEAHWLVVGGLAEETLAGPEHHREDH